MDTLVLLYMHFLFSELEELLKSLSVGSRPWGAHCCGVSYHHLSFLRCHSRAKELCVLFAQLPHLHVMMTSISRAKCPVEKFLWFRLKDYSAFSLCPATWTSGTPVSWRSSSLSVPPFFLIIVSDKHTASSSRRQSDKYPITRRWLWQVAAKGLWERGIRRGEMASSTQKQVLGSRTRNSTHHPVPFD